MLDRLLVSRLPAAHRERLFKGVDKDGDGAITLADMTASAAIQKHRKERDLDGDGRISFAEFAKSPRMARVPAERKRAIFDRLDQNKDGFLDAADWKDRPRPDMKPDGRDGRPGPRRPGPMAPDFSRLDKDGDGALSFEEFRVLPRLQDVGEDAQEDRFEELDKNGDGKLQRDEMPGPGRDRQGPGKRDPDKKKERGPRPPVEEDETA